MTRRERGARGGRQVEATVAVAQVFSVDDLNVANEESLLETPITARGGIITAGDRRGHRNGRTFRVGLAQNDEAIEEKGVALGESS